jgi:hypothetical protein
MEHRSYESLIGEYVKLFYERCKKTTVVEGKILWSKGCWLGLALADGGNIGVLKPTGRDIMVIVDAPEKQGGSLSV